MLQSFTTFKKESIVTKRVPFGEPYIRERKNASHWLTENARRESARRFFVRGSNHAGITEFAAIRGRQMSLRQTLWFETETRGTVPKCHVSVWCPCRTGQNSQTLWFTGGRRLTGRFGTVPVANPRTLGSDWQFWLTPIPNSTQQRYFQYCDINIRLV